jgi:hypothetical protein
MVNHSGSRVLNSVMVMVMVGGGEDNIRFNRTMLMSLPGSTQSVGLYVSQLLIFIPHEAHV